MDDDEHTETGMSSMLLDAEVRCMSAEQNRVKVDIFGQVYTLRGSGSPDRLVRFAQRVDDKMNELFAQNPRLDMSTLAVLTALNLAEEYDTLSDEYDRLLDALELEARQALADEPAGE